MITRLRSLFTTPIKSYRHWGVIVLVALAFILAPQFPYNDWERNTEGLTAGLAIYQNENAVYPPWGLVLLWPYRLLTAPGSRVASVLVVGWLAARSEWSLTRFFTVVLSPFFIWTMLMSNIDVLALLFPIVLWEATRQFDSSLWGVLGRAVALSILAIKPQGSFLLVGFLIWSYRARWHELLLPIAAVATIVISTSIVGNPPLLLQWLYNLQHPSEENQLYWSINNVSLTEVTGPLVAVLVLVIVVGATYFLKHRVHAWNLNHTYSALMLGAMLLSPYASNQSVIVPLAFVSSLPMLLIQYLVVFGGSIPIYRDYDPWWTLVLGVIALWLYRSPQDLRDDTHDVGGIRVVN